ncbi:sensor domain-containing protein [Paenibacillus turpanensis]|uniref:sensor domain-containing protein n=1 Tax=Paenibacillus turpanensis TaxID=2689078 RepID=UPI00140787E6|nr:bifunctional diguanylate cyclase/phosphodiesterase [Paenibacillus turpanensis]
MQPFVNEFSMDDQYKFAINLVETLSQYGDISFMLCEPGGGILHVNSTFERTFGWTAQEAIAYNPALCDEEEAARFLNILSEQRYSVANVEIIRKRKDGSCFQAKESVTPIRNEKGEVLAYACFTLDLSENTLNVLSKSDDEESFRALFDSNPDAVFSLGLDCCLTSANSALEKMTGYKQDQLIGKTLDHFVVPRAREVVIDRYQDALKGISSQFETMMYSKDGEHLLVQLVTLPITIEGQVKGVYCIARNVTEQKKTEDKVTHMAYHDALTNLPNRRKFHEHTQQILFFAAKNNEKAAVLMIDLDGFSAINDAYGHTIGDTVLQIAAKRMQNCIRDIDMIARIGGDEFTITLPHITEADHAVKVADRILYELNKPFYVRGLKFEVSGSVGIAIFPDDGHTTDILLRHADTAMYRVKENGKNSFGLYSGEMRQTATFRQRIERELLNAIKYNQFVLHYQPQFDVTSGKIVGVESLIRWIHPERGIVYPGEFIPIAEQSDLIVPIGEWVLRTACMQGKMWYDSGHHNLRMAVNLSARQLQQDCLVERISAILQETGLPPSSLDLEITESVAIQNPETVIQKLKALADLGIQISVDDFGTGFSSLSYLKLLPIHKLKIDRTFISDIANQTDAAIVSSIVALAHNLNLEVVVEGVETTFQREWLPKLGCSMMQGFFFSKPVPPDHISNLLK